MQALALAALAAAVLLTGSPVLAQTPPDPESGAVAQATVPSGTLEYDTYQAMAVKTILAYGRNWDRLSDCKAWACYSTYFLARRHRPHRWHQVDVHAPCVALLSGTTSSASPRASRNCGVASGC